MTYELIPEELFKKQIKELSKKSQTQLLKKLIYTKQHPFSNKSLIGFKIKLFRIRFKDNNIEKRVIYTIKRNQILLLTILERKHDYKELKQVLNNYNL